MCDLVTIFLSQSLPSQKTVDQICSEYTVCDLKRAWRLRVEKLYMIPFGNSQQFTQAFARARSNYNNILDHLRNSHIGFN